MAKNDNVSVEAADMIGLARTLGLIECLLHGPDSDHPDCPDCLEEAVREAANEVEYSAKEKLLALSPVLGRDLTTDILAVLIRVSELLEVGRSTAECGIVHKDPDFARWLKDGLANALEECGAALTRYESQLSALAEVNRQDWPKGRADSADISKLFPGGVPDDPDVRDLVVALDAGKGGKKSQNVTARELTKETKGSDLKAQTLLRTIRRMKKRGEITL